MLKDLVKKLPKKKTGDLQSMTLTPRPREWVQSGDVGMQQEYQH